MAGSFPNLSRIEPDLERLLLNRAGNNRPVISNKSPFDENSGVSGLSPWIRLVSTVVPLGETKGGLVLDSVQPSNSFTNKYGNKTEPGIIGYELDLKTPVRIDGDGRGLRPSPIITSLTINDNRYREFSLSITAFTTEQLEKLTEYFMEPGFHILCEWGWNIAQSRREIVGSGNSIEPCDIAQYDKWSYITSKRRSSDFTYDAALAIITGGSISYNDDETYTITVKTQGIGEVAEYMQTHKGGVNISSNESDSGETFNPSDVENFQKDGFIGKSLFAQMYNSLPSFKQTNKIKNLINDPVFSDKANYVNFDEKIRELLIDSLNEATVIRSKKGTISLPKEAPLFSEQRFIRFELAVKIINEYDFDLKPKDTGLCPKKKTRDLRIDINDTICCGFPHMFSTDSTKLFIPNTKSPNFNLIQALVDPSNPDLKNKLIDKENLNDSKNLSNVHPKTERVNNFSIKEEKNGLSMDYLLGQPRLTPYAFPCTYELNEEVKPIQLTDPTFIPPNENAYFWGWLKDLYINFEFFLSCIQKPNYLVRDVFYDMLNGMSTACNSLWHFDIIESQSEDEEGDLMLKVIDRNFTGKLNLNFSNEPLFHPTGTKSPFIKFDFQTDIPSAMQNSVIQKKMSKKIEGNIDYPYSADALIGGVFSDKEDKVGTILNNEDNQNNDSTSISSNNREGLSDINTGDKNKNVLFDFFAERGSLYPKIQDINSKTDIVQDWYESGIIGKVTSAISDIEENNALIEDLVFVGAWNDQKELSNIYYIDHGRHDKIKGETTKKQDNRRNVPIGMFVIKFTVHGVSGFKLGDRIRFTDLPRKFIENTIYQVTSIEQSITESGWETSVEVKSRTYGDSEE